MTELLTKRGDLAFEFCWALLVIEIAREADCSRTVAQVSLNMALEKDYGELSTGADLFLKTYDEAVRLARPDGRT